ncbi:MAG: alpha/beta fold hydrolase [Verrucomicrobiota bacterium]
MWFILRTCQKNAVRTRIVIVLAVMWSAQALAMEGVVVLHGLCRSSASMRPLAAALAAAGYAVENVDYPSRGAGVAVLSEDAIGAALRSARLAGCQRVHFVTHSLGGILVRSYFARHREPRLGRVVMLGPPNQGSEVVDHLKNWRIFQVINGPAGGELGTDRDSVPRRLGPVSFELGVIAGDRSINWINSWLIPGSDDGKVSVASTRVAGMRDHLVVHATHPFLMKNRQVIAATLRFLATGAFLRRKPRP